MKKILFTSLIALVSIGCNNSAPTQGQNNTAAVPATSVKKEEVQTVAAHTTENQKPASQTGSVNSNSATPTSGGSPNTKAVDVTKMTETIEKAEKEFKAKPKDEKAKESLATAYFQRAFILTDAAQYSAAIGDFRKGLKLNPNDKEAKDMHDQIISIYESMGRSAPKEGEEKAPMPIGQ
jgi:tetratricopeptide (TPR) repeat protein